MIKAIILLLFNKKTYKTINELLYILYLKKFVKFYEHIDYLPLFNFAEIMKGNFNYLFVGRKSRRVPKVFFEMVFEQMNYQFESLNNSILRKKAQIAIYESKYAVTKNVRWKREYLILKKELSDFKGVPFNLDDFTDYIEHTYNHPIGSIDAKKISTAKAFKNYQKAIKHNKDLVAKQNKIKTKM